MGSNLTKEDQSREQAVAPLAKKQCTIVPSPDEPPPLTKDDYESVIRAIARQVRDVHDGESCLAQVHNGTKSYQDIIREIFCGICGWERHDVSGSRQEQIAAMFGRPHIYGTTMVRAAIASGVFDPKECPQYVINACAKPLSKFLRTTWCPATHEIWRLLKPSERVRMLYCPHHSDPTISRKWSFVPLTTRQMILIDKETAQLCFKVACDSCDLDHTISMLDISPGGWLDPDECQMEDFQVRGLPTLELGYAIKRYNQRTKEQVRKALCASLLVATVRDLSPREDCANARAAITATTEVARDPWLMRYIAQLMMRDHERTSAF